MGFGIGFNKSTDLGIQLIIYWVLINGSLSALGAAIAKGHEVTRVFFYNDGVNNANKLSEPQSDDRNIVKLWSTLAEEHEVDLVVCIAAALRRGIKEEVLADGFRISGLGQLVEAGIINDRLVVFGD